MTKQVKILGQFLYSYQINNTVVAVYNNRGKIVERRVELSDKHFS